MTLRRSPARTAKLRARVDELRELGDPRAAGRLAARLDAKPKRLRSVRKGSSRVGWQAMRLRILQEQGNLCALGGHHAFRLEIAHLDILGWRVPRGRYNDDHPANRRENLVALCGGPRGHHAWFDGRTTPRIEPEVRADLVRRFRMAIELSAHGGHGTRRTGGS